METCEQGISSFQATYNSERDAWMSVPGITIAYSRPKNLRDKLMPSTLFETPNCTVARFACKTATLP